MDYTTATSYASIVHGIGSNGALRVSLRDSAMFGGTEKVTPDLPPPGSPLSVSEHDQQKDNVAYVDVSTLRGLAQGIGVVSSQMNTRSTRHTGHP